VFRVLDAEMSLVVALRGFFGVGFREVLVCVLQEVLFITQGRGDVLRFEGFFTDADLGLGTMARV
jgi:hypothetical protein